MTQEWHDVLFLHWPVLPNAVREHVPLELELDLYNDMAWISLVFFKVKGNRTRFTPPVPGVSSFLQLNVRTYVTFKGKVGVHFFSLDASNPLIVKVTTLGDFLPYRQAKMDLIREENTFTMLSKYIGREIFTETLITMFEPKSDLIESDQFEGWLTERYHLWTKAKGRLFRIDISHSPWVLQKVTGTINENTMASFIKRDFLIGHPIARYSKWKKAHFFLPVIEK